MAPHISPRWSWSLFSSDRFGIGGVVCRDKTLVRLWLPLCERTEEHLTQSMLAFLEEHKVADATRGSHSGELAAKLEKFFSGSGKLPKVDLLWPVKDTATFRSRVLKACQEIAPGDVLSYQSLAEKAGNRKANRAVGNAMATNPLPLFIPCHRVLRSDGSLGNYGGGVDMKEWLLEREGALELT